MSVSHFFPRPALSAGLLRKTGRTICTTTGFTAVELIVALIIVATLMGLASVTLGNLAPRFDLDNGTRMTLMALNRARSQAVSRGQAVTVSFSSGYFVITNSGGEILAQEDFPTHVTVSGNDVAFDPLGTTASSETVTIHSGSHSRDVTVSLIGEVYVQ